MNRRRLAVLIGTLVVLGVSLVVAGVMTMQARTGKPHVVGPTGTPMAVSVPQARQPLTFGSITAAKHTVSLFVDPHCSHCVAFEQTHSDAIDRLLKEGRIALQIYATSFQGEASARAAAGMYCAAPRGYGYAFYRTIFANPTADWTPQQLSQAATELGGREDPAFTTCLTEASTTTWVESQNTAAAQDFQIEGTPTVLIDGADIPLNQIESPEALERKLG